VSAIDAIKRAPRWTWYVVGGVGIGAIAIKTWQGRDAEEGEATTADGTPIGDRYPGTTQPATTGGSPPGVIVPPIITGGDGGSISEIGAVLSGMVGGVITDLSGLVGTAIDANQQSQSQWIGTMGEIQSNWINNLPMLINAGSPPQPVAVNPPVVNVTVTPPAAPPQQQQQASPCPAGFPKRSTKDGRCYKEVQSCEKYTTGADKGKKYLKKGHQYADGTYQHVQNIKGGC
jgi:hypothetical protein